MVTCAGEPRAQGFAQGEATRAELRAVLDAFLTSPEVGLRRPRALPRSLHRRAVRWRARRLLEAPLRNALPEVAERAAGIAAGAAVPLDLVLLAPAAELMLGEVDWQQAACSAVALGPARTANGEPALAKSFDYPERYRVGFLVRRSAPQGGLSSIEVTAAPLAGCHSGLNAAGLAVTYNYGHAQQRSPHPIPVSGWVQRVLERCRTVDEAIALLRGARRGGGAILTLADSEGALAVVELSPARLAVRRDPEALAATNHYLTPELVAQDVPSAAVYGPRAIPALRGRRVRASSEARLERLDHLLTGPLRRGVTASQLIAALRDHGPAGRGNDLTVCRHGPHFETTCGVILLPASRRLLVAFGRPCEQHFVELPLDPAAPPPSPPRRARRVLPAARTA